MKKLAKTLVVALLAMMMAVFAACFTVTEATIAFTVDSPDFTVTKESTLLDYMNFLSDNNVIEFKIDESGMVTEIDGVANTEKSYWMLYTDDTANSNSDFGTIEYEGKTYLSATAGAKMLIIKQGATYVWNYQTF